MERLLRHLSVPARIYLLLTLLAIAVVVAVASLAVLIGAATAGDGSAGPPVATGEDGAGPFSLGLQTGPAALLGVSVLALVLLSWTLARSITRPLQRIRTMLEQMPDDPLETAHAPEPGGQDELARVARLVREFARLPNRQLLTRHLGERLAVARARNGELSLILVDVDRFNDLNNLVGEQAANRILDAVERRIRRELPPSATLGRVAADAFVAALPEAEPDDVIETANHILLGIAAPIELPDREVLITASGGIARYPTDGSDPQELLNAADQAVRQAKDAGGGTVRLFPAEAQRELVRHLELTRHLRDAIQADELQLAWQPQVSLATGAFIGAEALLRWVREDGQAVSPADFVPAAERSGLIRPLGDWVIERVCREAALLQPHLPAEFRFALNISPLQVHPATCEHLERTARRHGLDPTRLEVEITETSVSSATADLIEVLRRLEGLGVSVAIDDFGTGYSNIASIKDLPVDRIKLDRLFVRELPDGTTSREIAQAVIAMAHAMNLEILAEGIETEAQAQALRALHCDAAQGFLFSHPVPVEALRTLLAGDGG